MRSLRQSLILVSPLFQAIMFISTVLTPAFALASPVSFPMPFMNADYGNHLASIPHATRRIIPKDAHLHDPSEHSKTVSSKYRHGAHTNSSSSRYHHTSRASYQTSRVVRRDTTQMENMFGSLSTHQENAISDSRDLQDMASQSASHENDPDFQQDAAAKLSSFQANMLAVTRMLSDLTADKGLANYDKNNQLETILKDLVNANKNALSAVYVLINNDPTLGPILGPIVYEIKCILDDLLDITENLTDGLLNIITALLPEISDTINSTISFLCSLKVYLPSLGLFC